MSTFSINPENVRSSLDDMRQQMQTLHQSIATIATIQRDLRSVLKSTSAVKIESSLNLFRAQLQDQEAKLKSLIESGYQIISIYKNVEKEITDSARRNPGSWLNPMNASGSGNVRRQDLTPAEKDSLIRDFEREHPEEAEAFNNFLHGKNVKGLTAEDIREIKYLAYTAGEPYRSIYFSTLSKYGIGSTNQNGTAFYRPGDRTVNYDYPDSFKDDPRGPFTVFFHESGHAIDDVGDKALRNGSDTEKYKAYSRAMGKEVTLYQAIEYDVYYNRNNPHSVTSLAEQLKASKSTYDKASVDHVVKAFQNGTSKGLSKNDLKLFNAVKNEFSRTTGSDANYEAVTDVYGGMSGNHLRNGGYGHDTDYWDDKSNVSKELWAEYFSYNMSGSQENLDHLNEYFPEASRIMQQYAMEWVNKSYE